MTSNRTILKAEKNTNKDSFTREGRAKEYYHEMREACKAAVDLTTDYLASVEKHRPFPDLKPGFLLPKLPYEPPEDGVAMETILKDVDKRLMPGVTHWNHPHFHAYFAMANSYPALCAEIIASGIGGIGFTWASSPISTELEVAMTNWMAKMLGLPDFYLHHHSDGGGVIGTTCSEQAVVTMMAARNKAINNYHQKLPGTNNFEILSKLVSYSSSQAHRSIERAGFLNLIPVRKLPINDKFQVTGEILERAIKEDLAKGLIPFYCVVTLGTTSCCSFDRLSEIGPVCKKYGLWVHVDAAYAGSAFVCPETRHLLEGVEYSDSFAFNPHKWLLTNSDSTIAWFRDVKSVVTAFSTDAQYLKYNELGKMPDYRNWQLSFGRRFRSLKLWFVIRKFGVKGLQEYIRGHIRMAKYLASRILNDPRFEIVGEVTLGLVCFRIKNNNELTRQLYVKIEKDGRIHLVTSEITLPKTQEDVLFIRVAIVNLFTDENVCDFAYEVISEVAEKLMTRQNHLTN